MSTLSGIGLSAMRVAEMRLQAASSNIANAQTIGRAPSAAAPNAGAYQPVDVVQIAQPDGGVAGQFVPRPDGTSLVAMPDSPLADAAGMVSAPNIDLATEMSTVLMARIAYQAAIMTMRAQADMSGIALNALA